MNKLVAASSPAAFYGVVAGTFSGQLATKSAIQKGSAMKVFDRRVFCPGGETCVLFLEDSLAAFGTLSQLKEIIRARECLTARLSSNSSVVSMLKNTDSRAPVRGALFGGQLETAISDMLRTGLVGIETGPRCPPIFAMPRTALRSTAERTLQLRWSADQQPRQQCCSRCLDCWGVCNPYC